MPPKYNFKKAFAGKKNKRRVKRATKVIDKIGKYKNRVSTVAQLAALGLNGMRLLNIEKKRIDVAPNQTGTAFALTNGALSGAYNSDITPLISEGITGSSRNGLSLKLVSACMDIQIKQQASTVNQFRYKYFIVCRPDASQTLSADNAFNLFFEVNPFSGVRDIHSNRDPEYFHMFRVIKTGRGSLSQDQITSGVALNQWKIPLRLNHHLKYNTDISTTTTKNQLYLFFVADSGDIAGTGGIAFYNVRYYYVDN